MTQIDHQSYLQVVKRYKHTILPEWTPTDVRSKDQTIEIKSMKMKENVLAKIFVASCLFD